MAMVSATLAWAAEASLQHILTKTAKPKYYGRFNQGVVTINLWTLPARHIRIWMMFWKIFDERLELCRRALMLRHERLKGTPSDVAPILWQNGALARLKRAKLSTSSCSADIPPYHLAMQVFCECVRYMTGKSHTDPSATPFALEVMRSTLMTPAQSGEQKQT